jgi:two-component system, OmpR family, phosphate regulon sensor histidine kinase PhoR
MENDRISFQLNESENEQMAFVMHEIHTSLNSITSKLHYLSHKDFSRREDQAEAREGILEASQCADTIRMFLDYLQLSTDPKAYFEGIKMRSIDLWTTFKKPNEYFKNIMRKKRLSYNVEKTDERIPNIEAYPIIHALANIMLDNAIKYAPCDSDIHCLFESTDEELIITMENEGPYLAEDEMKNIFKKGIRGKYAEKSEIRGHGYGMHFLKCIIDAHDGDIEIESNNEYTIDKIIFGEFRCKITIPVQ